MKASFLILTSVFGCFGLNSALALESSSISGKVAVETAAGDIVEDHSIVMLVPTSISDKAPDKPQTHEIQMTGKQFAPRYIVAKVGDSVSFVNGDNFDHNVFSPSKQDEFDLGSYPFRGTRSHVFRKAGLSKIYCNVHSKMAAFVVVQESGWGVVTEPDGTFQISKLPVGTYRLKVWNLRGTTEQELTVSPDKNAPLHLAIKGMTEIELSHPNKFGKPYREEEEDEIY